jgi:hypothetical protein
MAWMQQPMLSLNAGTPVRLPVAVPWFVPSHPWIYRHPSRDGRPGLRLARRPARWYARLGAIARHDDP